MVFDSLKKFLAKTKYIGVGEDRIVERTQGCWNCIHANVEGAKKLWWEAARESWLQAATKVALTSPKGEDDDQVKMIRRKVPGMDVAIEQGEWCTCPKGVRPVGNKEEPVANFVPVTYLCRMWTGRQGASVARAGQKADKLPEELQADLMDPNGPKLS